MKKILLLFGSVLMVSWLFSQSLELYYEGELMESMAEITLLAHSDSGMMVLDTLDVKNVTEISLDVVCVREIIENGEGSENSFCLGSFCFPPYVDTSSNPITIVPQSMSYEFIGNHDPKEIVGTTKVKYTFYDIENPSDFEAIIVSYESTGPNAVNINRELFTLSKAYPNPANNTVSVDYNLIDVPNARIAFFNLLGAKVNEVELSKSEGTLTINTADFTEGIYFYSLIIENEASQTQKLIVRH